MSSRGKVPLGPTKDPERSRRPHGGGGDLGVFSDLIDWGLEASGIKCVVSDEHKWLKRALRWYFPTNPWTTHRNAIWQRCRTYYQRNAASKVPHKARGEVHRELRFVVPAPGLEFVQHRTSCMIEDYQSCFSPLANRLEEPINEPLAVFGFPREKRKRWRTTNGMECFQGGVKRRTNLLLIFPNRASCLRFISALAMEQSEEWITGRRYLRMELLEEREIPIQWLEPIISDVIPVWVSYWRVVPILKDQKFNLYLTEPLFT